MSIIVEILKITAELREKHEKRSDARDYIDNFGENLFLPDKKISFKISLGYFERFLMKLNHEKIGVGENKCTLILEKWVEGCGYFSGNYKLKQGDKVVKEGDFEWEGVGTISDSWDNFKLFSV